MNIRRGHPHRKVLSVALNQGGSFLIKRRVCSHFLICKTKNEAGVHPNVIAASEYINRDIFIFVSGVCVYFMLIF